MHNLSNLWDTVKAVVRGKCVGMNANIKNTEISQEMILCYISNSWKNNTKLNTKPAKGEKNINKGQYQ
jgi:hypothetical protein